MVSVPEARAFADRGLEGDRFFRESWKAAKRPDKAVSLIEEETLQAAAAELGTAAFGDKSRRNIVTRGVPLVQLLDREFTIGDVVLRGIRLFEPCGHLEKVSQVPGIFRALEHRSGLKAAILSDGVIRVGDMVAVRGVTRLATSSAL
jgi:MOSC domain-containing protein YiiM